MALLNRNNFQIGIYLSKAIFRFAQIAQLRFKKQLMRVMRIYQ